MKTFQDFIVEADYRAPVNTRQTFRMDATTQKNLNKAIPMGPGKKKTTPVKFTLKPVNIPMK